MIQWTNLCEVTSEYRSKTCSLLQFSKIQFLECTQKPGLESWFDENLAAKDQTKCKRGILLLLLLPLVGHLPWDNGSRSRSCTGTTCCPGNRKTVSLWSVFGSRRSNRRPVYCRSARTIKPCWNRTPPLKWNEQPLYRDNLVFWYFMDVELFVGEVRKVWDSFWKKGEYLFNSRSKRIAGNFSIEMKCKMYEAILF